VNVLLTSVGRRSYLVDYFKEALGNTGKVFGANSTKDTSAMQIVDEAFEVPYVNDPEYVPTLIKICKEKNVGLVVSLFDIDLPYLAEAKAEFNELGITVVISSPKVIEIANDKWLTYQFLKENGLDTPTTHVKMEEFCRDYEEGKIDFPVIIKPRWGMGSLSMFKAYSMNELVFFYGYCKAEIKRSYLSILADKQIDNAIIIQEIIDGPEYGVDVFNDLDGNHLTTVIKQKLAMRSGETDSSLTIEHKTIEAIASKLSELLSHVGNLDVDILEDKKTGAFKVLEFNARFGGGYPFSHLSGVNFPKALIDMANKKDVAAHLLDANAGTLAYKFIKPELVEGEFLGAGC